MHKKPSNIFFIKKTIIEGIIYKYKMYVGRSGWRNTLCLFEKVEFILNTSLM